MARFKIIFFVALVAFSCGGNGSEADQRGVGSECTTIDDCTEDGQDCLTEFLGGYCGIKDCTADASCPEGSFCVSPTNPGVIFYCFLNCVDKVDCNVNRTIGFESNCVGGGTVDFIETENHTGADKVCIPPSSGP